MRALFVGIALQRVSSLIISSKIFSSQHTRAPLKYLCSSSDGNQPSSAKNDDKILLEKLQTHQSLAARLPIADEIKTLIDTNNGYGVLSTNSAQYPGYPVGSVVGFALDDIGKPFFVFSSMSSHTKDVVVDGKVSLTVTARNFKGAADDRAVLIGSLSKLAANEVPSLREKYLLKHKDAFWIDFG